MSQRYPKDQKHLLCMLVSVQATVEGWNIIKTDQETISQFQYNTLCIMLITYCNRIGIRNYTCLSTSNQHIISRNKFYLITAVLVDHWPAHSDINFWDLYIWHVWFIGTELVLDPTSWIHFLLDWLDLGPDKFNLGSFGITALTFEDFVNDFAKACNFHIRGLHHILLSITFDVANDMAACIVGKMGQPATVTSK